MPSVLTTLGPVQLLLSAAGAVLAAALLLLLRARLQRHRAQRRLGRLLAGAQQPASPAAGRPVQGWPGRLGDWLALQLDTGLGRALLADEDKVLLDRAGFDHRQARGLYLGLRLGGAALVALLGFALRPATPLLAAWAVAGGAAAGLMLPKWLLRLRAAQRLASVREELPLLVDLLRLLQGAGMGMDQSLRVAATEFRDALPVLGAELELALRQHAAGMPRADSFRRLVRLYEGDALAELAALLVQLDRHGGAVDEPLRRFGLRLREQRRAAMRATVGQLNVKMTVVMVLTLLPALMLVIAGPAFLAIARSLART